MKKNDPKQRHRRCPALRKMLNIMKVTTLLFFLALFQVSANSYSQQTRLNLKFDKESLENVFSQIEAKSEFSIFYKNALIQNSKEVSGNFENASISEILAQVLKDENLTFTVKNKLIMIVPKDENTSETNGQQQKSVTGKVNDATGGSLPGVSVVVKGTTNGTITDADGNYSLSNIPENSTLQFSFVGMKLQEVRFTGQSSLNVVLLEETVGIDEVMVVAYGTQKKRDVTGAMYNVDAEKLQSLPVGQFAQKIQGQLAGVQINQTNGRPGEGMSFRIRGATSINADNSPLFVVDGFPIVGGINNINPDEIESYTVLKDAAATSLYGSRAGNGVVLITTKKGKNEKTEIDFGAYYGTQGTPNRGRPDLMNARDFAAYEKGVYEDKIRYEGWKNSKGVAEVPVEYQNPDQYTSGYNWYDILLREAPIQNYNLSITNSHGKTNTSVVGSYFSQDGVVLNTYYKRYSLRANSEYKPSDWLKFGFNIAPTFQESQNHGTDGYRSIIDIASTFSPLVGPYDENGNLRVSLSAPNLFAQPNWLRVLKERQNVLRSTRVLSNAYMELDLMKGLKYKLQTGIDLQSQNQRTFNPSTTIGGLGTAPPGIATGTFDTGFYYSWLIENMFTYNKSYKGHNLELLAGYTAQKYTSEGNTLTGSNYPDDEIPWVSAASTRIGSTSTTQWSMLSYISSMSYNYKDKYLLQASFRRDGSSRFGSNNKWANFPSVSVGWVMSDENFFKIQSLPVNYAKVRASYGITGNNNIGNYTYIAAVNAANYSIGGSLVPGKALNGLSNNDLTWEESKQFNVGLEVGLLKDRIYLVYDYYKKTTDGLLYQLDVPRASGFSNMQYNIGRIDFWGHEISVSTKNLTGDFKWNTDINLSFNRNEVKKLGTNNVPIGGVSENGDINRLAVGQPVGVFMGYVNDGVYMTQEEFNTQPKHVSSEIGTVRYKDISGPNGVPDGVINLSDRTIIGDPNPDMIFGITNQFYWKKFDLSIVMTGVLGGDIIARSYENTNNLDGVFNVTNDVSGRWRSVEDPGNGIIPRTKSGTTALFRANNSRWVSDGTHLALKNLTLGYALPKCKYYSKARVYFSGQQLAIFTKYTGGNPEVSSSMNWNGLGVDNTAYPIPRTFTVGCNVTF